MQFKKLFLAENEQSEIAQSMFSLFDEDGCQIIGWYTTDTHPARGLNAYENQEK